MSMDEKGLHAMYNTLYCGQSRATGTQKRRAKSLLFSGHDWLSLT